MQHTHNQHPLARSDTMGARWSRPRGVIGQGLAVSWCVGLLWTGLIAGAAEVERPNVLFIVSEDNGTQFGCYGDSTVPTPHVDRLAASGVRFANAYVTQAVCSPSRSTLYTGLYPHQNGQLGLASHAFAMVRHWPTLPSLLRGANYRTGLMGKLHVLPEEAFPFDFRWDDRRAISFAERDLPATVEQARRFMVEDERPFCLVVNWADAHLPFLSQSHGMPHDPVSADHVQTPAAVGVDTPRLREHAAGYYNCISRIDAGIGLLLEALEQTGKAKNTLVIYVSDHGPQFARGKVTSYEFALKVPLIVRWPQDVVRSPQGDGAGTTRDELVSTIDLLPTILEAAGVPSPANLPGRSLHPLAHGPADDWREYVFCEWNTSHPFPAPPLLCPQRSVRDARYKLITNLLSHRRSPAEKYYTSQALVSTGPTQTEIDAADEVVQEGYATWRAAPPVELYDLEADPHEFVNLADHPQMAAVRTRLEAALLKWRRETHDPLLNPHKLAQFVAEHSDRTKRIAEHGRKSVAGWNYASYLYGQPDQSSPAATRSSTPPPQSGKAPALESPEESSAAPRRPPNVLLIAVDDLRPALGCYGDTVAQTPAIDRLARRGMVFERAYCQSALCNPSRASLLTGRRPETLGVFDLHAHFRDRFPDLVTLPEHFKHHGYHTQAIGKVFHPALTSDTKTSRLHDPQSWSAPWWTPPFLRYHTPAGDASCRTFFNVPDSLSDHEMRVAHPVCRGLVWEASSAPESEYADAQVSAQAIRTLGEIKDRPFFLAVGFYKPHVPFIAPQKYFDRYPLDTMPLAEPREFPRNVPAWVYTDVARGTTSAEIRGHAGVDRTGTRVTYDDQHERELRRAYYACVSFVDAQIGAVLDELERLRLADNTIVVIFGDHGYHVGESALWGKMTNFEYAARAPLIVAVPDQATAGASTKALVEFVDLYPALAELCDVPAPKGMEGTSFAPLLHDPQQPWKQAAFTSLLLTSTHRKNQPAPEGEIYGLSMRTDRYRYTEWQGVFGGAVELYDHQDDPLESCNLATAPEQATRVGQLRRQLAGGWKEALPPSAPHR